MNILFIPGNSQSTNTFSEQVNSRLLAEHQVNVFDLEAAANSLQNPTAETFFFSLKDKLLKLHQEQQFDFIIGHSWGGHLLIESISKMEGVKGIMTFGAPYMSKPPRMQESFLPNTALPLFYTKELNKEQLIQLANACLYNKEWQDYITDGMSKSSGILRELTPTAIATGSYNNEVDIIEQLNIPLAIIHGENEKMINVNYYHSLNIPTLWKNKVHIIPQSGHFPQLENATGFNEILAEFINDIEVV